MTALPASGHYATHAIDHFNDLIPLLAKAAPHLAQLGIEPLLVRLLADAVKFVLPEDGRLLAEHDYSPAVFDGLRLPHPLCALEFAASPALYAAGSGLHFSPKRIALVFDPRGLADADRDALAQLTGVDAWPARAVAVMGVYEVQGVWTQSAGCVLIDLDADRPHTVATGTVTPLARRCAERLDSGTTTHGVPCTFLPFFRLAQMEGLSFDRAAENLYIDLVDELRTAWQFLAVQDCENVASLSLTAPKLASRKRALKGKAPLFERQVICVRAQSGLEPLHLGHIRHTPGVRRIETAHMSADLDFL